MDTSEKFISKILKTLSILKAATKNMQPPAAQMIVGKYGRDPFLVLVSCILSLRTRDPVSFAASVRLFDQGTTPKTLVHIPLEHIQNLIYSVGFYRRKALAIKKICHILLEHYQGQVPHETAALMNLPGVGLKTAHLVRAEGFGIPALCVDTHVHRITNRLGWVSTKTPEQTEQELQKIIPQSEWIETNRLFVMWGQNICVPISPRCSICPIRPLCKRVGVTRSR